MSRDERTYLIATVAALLLPRIHAATPEDASEIAVKHALYLIREAAKAADLSRNP